MPQSLKGILPKRIASEGKDPVFGPVREPLSDMRLAEELLEISDDGSNDTCTRRGREHYEQSPRLSLARS